MIYLLSPYCEERVSFPLSSLEYIRYYLKDHGYAAQLIDCAYHGKDLSPVIGLLRTAKDPIVGITAYTRERFHAYELIRRVRQEVPRALIVVGGRHFGFLAQETLEHLPEVDIVVRGEGEVTFKEICDAVTSKGLLATIRGISYRADGVIRHNPDRAPESNIDQFRYFDASDLDDVRRHTALYATKTDPAKYFPVFATRGCPNNCVYCSLTASRVRFRSVDSIMEEIERKIAVTGVRRVRFVDSSLTHSREFLTQLCERIISKKLNIRWNCYSRVNVDPDVLHLMKRAGLEYVEIGLESASPRVLKAIKKNIDLNQFEQFCKTAYEIGIKSYVFCLLSLPDECLEDVDMTINYIRTMAKYIYRIGVQVTRIMPDAALCQIARERGALPKDFDWFRPYDNQLAGVCSQLYRSVPHYFEHLSVTDVKRKLAEFRTLSEQYFTNWAFVAAAFRKKFNRNLLNDISPRRLCQRAGNVLRMLRGVIRTLIHRRSLS